ncbi:MAG: glycosyltransferase [Actinomycetota bacterium]
MNPAPDSTGSVLMLVWTSVHTDTRVLREAQTLVEAGWHVHIIGRAIPADFVAPQGISTSSVGAPPASTTRTRQLSQLERTGRWILLPEHVSSRLRAWQRAALAIGLEHSADIVHAHDFSALPVGAALADTWGVPLVYDSHELWCGRPRAGRPTPVQSRRETRREQRLGDRADVVLTVGAGIADALSERYRWPDIRVVRNTFPKRDHVSAALAEPMVKPIGAVYAGRIAPYRELEVIAAASRTIDVPITLVGPADADYLTQFDPGLAQIRASCTSDQVDQLLTEQGLALVTHSDRWENHRLALPNKLFQAVRVGVPVIATDVGELARTVREYDLGELYSPGDSVGMGQAIERAIARYQQLSDQVRQASDALGWEVDAQVLKQVYRDLSVSK